MSKSNVFFTDMRCQVGTSLLVKLERLIDRAGIEKIDFLNRFTAIKIHFGEPGNLAFLRPNFAKTLVDKVKSLGGLPFLTDCNTLYIGRRKHALEHLDTANENGFWPMSTGCQIIIGDGLKGTDDIEIEIPGGVYCKTAFLGRAIMDADIIISLNHFKGHEVSGFGGAIKNLGMGCGSRTGKTQMHLDGKPSVHSDICTGCGFCFKFCAQGALSFDDDGKAYVDDVKCVGCGRCIAACNFDAIENDNWYGAYSQNCRMVEYTKAAINGRPNFHISIVNQVSPYCDCHDENDAAIVPDIGMFASFDPIALDKACIDAVNNAPVISTIINSDDYHGNDHFKEIHPESDWHSLFSHAEKIGLGNGDYTLTTI